MSIIFVYLFRLFILMKCVTCVAYYFKYFFLCQITFGRFSRQTVAEFLDLTLLKDLVYDNIIFGMALTFFADLTFFTLEPLFLGRHNLTKVSTYLQRKIT